MMIKTLHIRSRYLRSFSILLRNTQVSASDKSGEGLSTTPYGHSTSTSRELSFEEQYAAKRDYEILKKLADLSQDQSKKFNTLLEQDKSNRMNADLHNIQQNINEMQSIIDERLSSIRVANIDVSAKAVPGEELKTPWRKQNPINETTENKNEATKTTLMDKSFYPDLTNDL